MALTISTTTSAGITLSNQSYNPVTVTGNSRISKTAGADGALYGKGGGSNSWTINNYGVISGSAAGGIYLGSFSNPVTNGVVINQSGGTIASDRYALYVHGPAAVTNKLGGTISAIGGAAVYVRSRATVLNYGVITDSSGFGIYAGGGSVINQSGATISAGKIGIQLQGVGTVINAGVIIGASTDAVLFAAGSPADLLVVDPGAVLIGRVNGGGGVLELAAGSGGAAGQNIFSTTGITNFTTLQFDAGAQWVVAANVANSLIDTIAITGFTANDTIDLIAFAAVTETFASHSLVLTNISNQQVTLQFPGNLALGNFHVASDKFGGTDITAVRILTWTNTGTADWNTPTAWNLGSVPISTDSAVIDNPGSNTVTIANSESITIGSVTVGGTNTLAVTGILKAQSIVDNAVLAFVGVHTLTGTPLTLGGTLEQLNKGTLTLGSGEIVTQSAASVLLMSSTSGGETIVNQGTINAGIAGGLLAIAPLNFTNAGTIVVNNETVTIGYGSGTVHGTWKNSGVIALSGTASLVFGGSLATAGIGTITGASGITEVGTLDNTGATLNVGNGTELGTVNLATGAMITGGTIVDHSNGFSFNRNGTFNAVTYRGTLNVATNNARINITNGLTAIGSNGFGPGIISLTEGGDAALNFIGSQTIDNATINLNGTDSTNPLTEIDISGSNGSQLTLGANLTVISTTTNATADIRNTTSQDFTSVLSLGTITAAAAGGTFDIMPVEGFTNSGTIFIMNGENVEIAPGLGTFTNGASATISVSGTSQLEIFYTGASARMNNLGTIMLDNGATLDLASGLFTPNAVGNIVNHGGTTEFSGTFDDQNGTITLGPGSEFNELLLAGNLRNATVLTSGAFSVVPGAASLQNVLFQGPLGITTNATTLTIAQGVTLSDASGTQPGMINVSGQNGNLIFANQYATSQSLDNATLNIGNAISADVISPRFSGGTFTIGTGATIVSATTGAQAILNAGSSTTINFDGTLNATGKGGTFTITGVTSGSFASVFDNNGLILVGNGDTLSVGLPVASTAGTVEMSTGGVADIAGAVAAGQTLAFTDATGVLRLHQPGSVAATILGFVAGDTIDLAGISANAATWSGGQLTISEGGSKIATLTVPGNFSPPTFIVSSDGTGGSQITATCFGEGTRLRTPRGQIAVEHLREGDLVLTISGHPQPVRWVGHRRVDFRYHPNRQRVLPVRITAHAFGSGRPTHDLLLSPDHSVFVDGVLIPVRHLTNGSTIVQFACPEITYFHVELPQHDVVLANGMPAESYLEAGARGAFSHAAGVMQLHPDFAPAGKDFAVLWEARGYAPLVVAGEPLHRVRRNVARQAALLGLARHRRVRSKRRAA